MLTHHSATVKYSYPVHCDNGISERDSQSRVQVADTSQHENSSAALAVPQRNQRREPAHPRVVTNRSEVMISERFKLLPVLMAAG